MKCKSEPGSEIIRNTVTIFAAGDKLISGEISVRLLFWLLLLAAPLLTPAWPMTSARAQGVTDADRACAMISVYAKMGVSDDAMKALVVTCNQNTNPEAICNAMMVVKISNRANPGLVCTDHQKCEQEGLACQ